MSVDTPRGAGGTRVVPLPPSPVDTAMANAEEQQHTNVVVATTGERRRRASTSPIERVRSLKSLFGDSVSTDVDENGAPVFGQRSQYYTLWERIKYRVNTGIEHPSWQALSITFFFVAAIFFGGILIHIGSLASIPKMADVNGTMMMMGDEQKTIAMAEAIWLSWAFIADPGTHADSNGVANRIVAFFVTVGGILLSAAIIGFVVDGIKKKLEDLETGRSKVIEAGHVLVLGWTLKTIQLLNQLTQSMESDGGGTIVLLSGKAKKEAEAEVNERCSLRGSTVIVRTGSIIAQGDLNKCAAHLAKSIVILAPEGAPDKADATVLRSVLSLKSLKSELRGHVVAEMRDIDNTSLVELVGGESVETIVSHDIVGRLMIQAARSKGLAEVYAELLGFEGDEIYIKRWPEFIGKTFDEVLLSFDTAVPIGIATSTSFGADKVILNPPGERVLGLTDKIVVIAEDDDSYEPLLATMDTRKFMSLEASLSPTAQLQRPEKVLMTGWRRDIDDVIVLLDELVAPGSELHMLSELPIEEREERLEDGGLCAEKDLKNLKLVHHIGNPAVRRKLKEVEVWKFTSVLILSDEALETDMMHSDSHSLAILLLIRDLQFRKKRVVSKALEKLAIERSDSSSPSSSSSIGAFQEAVQPARRSVDERTLASIRKFKEKTAKNREAKRRLQEEELHATCLVTCEILDPQTHIMIMQNSAISHMSDFVLSNNTVSKVLAMVSESREVKSVLTELLGFLGCDLALCSVESLERECSYWDLFQFIRNRKQILVGWVRGDKICINPKGAERHKQHTWSKGDMLIVLTESRRGQSRSKADMLI